jgi:enoyl-CoA hydratase/carnithine racemase
VADLIGVQWHRADRAGLTSKERSRMTDAVLTEFSDGIAVITINRPAARNAVNAAVAEGIAAAMGEFEQRDDLAVAVVTGAGGTFCSGMDLKAFARGERPTIPGRGFAGLAERPPEKPLIEPVFASADAQEGARTFAEKRPPVWQGR